MNYGKSKKVRKSKSITNEEMHGRIHTESQINHIFFILIWSNTCIFSFGKENRKEPETALKIIRRMKRRYKLQSKIHHWFQTITKTQGKNSDASKKIKHKALARKDGEFWSTVDHSCDSMVLKQNSECFRRSILTATLHAMFFSLFFFFSLFLFFILRKRSLLGKKRRFFFALRYAY